jgi:Protein-tyrosine-phosphatase-like, N-terminal domain/Protein of unknown function (DUF3562)
VDKNSALQASNAQHIDRLADQLGKEYSSLVAPEAVAEVVRTEYERLCRESRVTDFVPILAERRVRARLRPTA